MSAPSVAALTIGPQTKVRTDGASIAGTTAMTAPTTRARPMAVHVTRVAHDDQNAGSTARSDTTTNSVWKSGATIASCPLDAASAASSPAAVTWHATANAAATATVAVSA